MEENLLPKHIAIIMDGNRRWAKEKGLDTKLGHKEGAENLKRIAKYANKIGIKYLTVYAFSTENWKRTKEEVGALMLLLQKYVEEFLNDKNLDNIKVNIIGDISKLDTGLQKSIDDINEDLVSDNLYTAGQPEPDLLIRPGGEQRISNYLLWQLAYTEFLFTQKYWPDFSESDLDEAISIFVQRNRKFGGK